MARPRNYDKPKTTCVQTEEELYDIAKQLGIGLSSAFNAGLCGSIESAFEDERNAAVTPDIIDRYRTIHLKSFDDLKKSVAARAIIKEGDAILATIQQRAVDHQEKQEERIRVYDTIEEKYRDIIRKQMKPWYNEVELLRDEEGNVIWTQDLAVA